MQIIYKKLGETPLEALERFRAERVAAGGIHNGSRYADVPMTYAGRLDPLAEGELLILMGNECKDKERYLGMDKEYEVEIVFGISTDTYDALGMAVVGEALANKGAAMNSLESFAKISDFSKYIGKFTQPYPPYSSKTVDGFQLHELARENKLPAQMPEREVEIYSIELLNCGKIGAEELKTRIFKNIALVKGDFRQEEIKKGWEEVLSDPIKAGQLFKTVKLKVFCSSGTYMRSLADRIGKDAGTGTFAIGIKRTKILVKQV